MYDIVLPQNNEKEFIKVAHTLGFKGLVFLYPLDKFQEYKHKAPIEILCGIHCNEKDIHKARNKSNLVCTDFISQQSLEKTPPHVVFELEDHNRKDFIHHRNSGMNQVIAKLLKKKKTAYAISHSMLQHNMVRALGRVEQNIKLYKKYQFPLIIASFARKPHEISAPHDMAAFFATMKLHPSQIKSAFISIKEIIEYNQKKRSGKIIRDGVEIV